MRYAAIDVGLKRIGLALSPDKKVVLPQKAIIRKNRNQAARDVSNFLKEWNVKELIVGIPMGESSQEEMEKRIKHFISLLELDGIKVHYIDEGNSSNEAKEEIKGVIKFKKDGRVDSLAAKIILERWIKENS